jgi:hypothetical protein
LALPVGLVNLVCKSVVATRLATVLISPSLSLSRSSSLFLSLPLSHSLSLSLPLSLRPGCEGGVSKEPFFCSAKHRIADQRATARSRAARRAGRRAGALKGGPFFDTNRDYAGALSDRIFDAEKKARVPAPLRTNRTRRVLHPVLIGHAASFTPY